MGRIDVHVHHRGYFVHPPNGIVQYVGGKVDELVEDTEKMCFADLEHYSVAFGYDTGSSLVYFQNDGHSFDNNVRVLYNDDGIKEMIEICKPFGCINLFVDHFDLEDLQTEDVIREEKLMGEKELGDSSSEDDPDYVAEGQDSESDEPEFYTDGSDGELMKNVNNRRIRKAAEANKINFELRRTMIKEREKNIEEEDYLSDELMSLSSSSEDEAVKKGYIGPPPVKNSKKRKHSFYNPKKITDGIKFSPGMRFGSMEEFRRAVTDYGLSERRAVQFNTNDPHRAQVVCETKCPFYIWCSRIKDSETVEIKTLVNEHLCTKPYNNKLASVKHLTEIYGERIRKNPTWKIKEMVETVRHDLEIEVSRIKLIRVRKAALEGVFESLKQHYSRVRDFGYQILLNNPQNRVDIRTTRLNESDPNKFKRIYICYHALKEGWKQGCRPILGLDGCFLKTVCGGQMLSAVGRDGNNQMYPVAYAVVESENADSWKWFIDLLRDDLSLGDGKGYTIISDQQKVWFCYVFHLVSLLVCCRLKLV